MDLDGGEYAEYLQSKNVKGLFVELLQQICLDKPDNVYEFIISYIQDKYANDLGKKMVEYEEEDDEEEPQDDIVSEMQEKERAVRSAPRRRSGVSAESVNPTQLLSQPKKVIEKSEADRQKISALLKQNFLFSELDNDAMNDLTNAVEEHAFEAGATIITQGDSGDFFYIVEEGEAHIFVNGVKVVESRAGDSFGELALMYDAPRAATIQAVTPMRCWAVDRQTFKLTLMDNTMKKRARYEKFLESIPILQTMYQYEKMTLADALKAKNFSAGEVVMREGEEGDTFYIIESGGVTFTQQTSNGEQAVVGEAGVGGYFGEIALLTKNPRAATATCKSDCSLLELDRKTFIRCMGPLKDILKRNMSTYKSWMEK
eukprot:c32232_g1_i1.p1 GENE.c32232_g1_i1~~c32232_g1_i1.p1  ORF type:complete len:372 (-),score=105.82 c32232_g1_i1:101-1216(-)